MNKKYIMVDLDDERISSLADVLTNKTSKRIINYLTDKEACESEIAQNLGIPANTVNYNIKKLVEAGLIEKSKSFFWSAKGKKMLNYRVANKKIVISPKPSSIISQMVLTIGIIALLALFVSVYIDKEIIEQDYSQEEQLIKAVPEAASGAGGVMEAAKEGVIDNISSAVASSDAWLWFFIGGVSALIIFAIARGFWRSKIL